MSEMPTNLYFSIVNKNFPKVHCHLLKQIAWQKQCYFFYYGNYVVSRTLGSIGLV